MEARKEQPMLQALKRQSIDRALFTKRRIASIAIVSMFALLAIKPSALAQQQCPYVTCGNGSDGAYNPASSGYFMPGSFSGTGVPYNVFNFTSVTIPAGVTITFSSAYDNAPVYWLVQGNVDVEGTLSLNGANGANQTMDVDVRLPALAGSGGYDGGVGGNTTTGQSATSGGGPGGSGPFTWGQCGGGGTSTSNQYLIPLIGGSGSGGANTTGMFGYGGGAGGGAILIATSGTITINGTLMANGGAAAYSQFTFCNSAQDGSGGSIRLVANTITGGSSAFLTAVGGSTECNSGPCMGYFNGRVRLETITSPTFNGSFCMNSECTNVSQSLPQNDFMGNIPMVPQASVQVTSINGQTITENPFAFSDIQIDIGQPVNVVISGNQVPVGTIPTLVILGENADQDLTCSGGLQQGTLPAGQTSCTIPITFNYGGSRGLVKATWQNPGSSVSTSQKK
jgi:hypothetical protein